MKAVIIFLLTCLFYSCNNSEDEQCCNCPPFDIVPSSPYDDPIWHPSGEIIGFNHTPIKEIKYTYGYDCPRQALYTYKTDSIGFWLINADGTNKRRILPYTLNTPAWSNDGKWIAFSNKGQICIMPFDGEQFDLNNITVLTTEGSSFHPTWSPNDNWIAYDSDHNSESGYFIWKINLKTLEQIKIIDQNYEKGGAREPKWGANHRILHTRSPEYGSEVFSMTESGNELIQHTNNSVRLWSPRYSTSGNSYSYLMSDDISAIQLYLSDFATNTTVQLTDSGCISYSWSPYNKIVYTRFDLRRIDTTAGTLWTMNHDGSDKKPLTYNHFETTY